MTAIAGAGVLLENLWNCTVAQGSLNRDMPSLGNLHGIQQKACPSVRHPSKAIDALLEGDVRSGVEWRLQEGNFEDLPCMLGRWASPAFVCTVLRMVLFQCRRPEPTV